MRELDRRLSEEAAGRRDVVTQVARQIEDVAAGGLTLETVGLGWLALGAVTANLPGELAGLFIWLGVG